MKTQYTNRILMIEPLAFGFNEETAESNYFQQKDDTPAKEIQQNAHQEYLAMLALLKTNGIDILSIKDTPEPHTPDAIFPNNWISFHRENKVALYPMYAENRRKERRPEIIKLAKPNHNCEITDYSDAELKQYALEGTGSIILDRKNMIAYAAMSERTQPTLVERFAADFGYQTVLFSAFQNVDDNWKLPIYHTNLMMSIAEQYAIVCLDAISYETERKVLIGKLKTSGKTIIEISEEQMYHYAGNALQVVNNEGESILVMSQTAYKTLNQEQINQIKSYNKIITPNIPTIERYGGGSVQSMMCEIF